MSNITLKVEVTAGTSIEAAFEEARDIARHLKCIIEFKFNGVVCLAFAEGDTDTGAKRFMDLLQTDRIVKIATNR